MGRLPDPTLAGTSYLGYQVNWSRPLEDPADGCPGAWYRVHWLDDLERYLRRRDDNGGRVPNPLFDSAPWQIQEAVMYFEGCEERRIRHERTIAHERALKEANKKRNKLPVMQSPRRR